MGEKDTQNPRKNEIEKLPEFDLHKSYTKRGANFELRTAATKELCMQFDVSYTKNGEIEVRRKIGVRYQETDWSRVLSYPRSNLNQAVRTTYRNLYEEISRNQPEWLMVDTASHGTFDGTVYKFITEGRYKKFNTKTEVLAYRLRSFGDYFLPVAIVYVESSQRDKAPSCGYVVIQLDNKDHSTDKYVWQVLASFTNNKGVVEAEGNVTLTPKFLQIVKERIQMHTPRLPFDKQSILTRVRHILKFSEKGHPDPEDPEDLSGVLPYKE